MAKPYSRDLRERVKLAVDTGHSHGAVAAMLKVGMATEQKREDVAEARAAWRESQKTLDPAKLAFADEIWASTAITRQALVPALSPGDTVIMDNLSPTVS